MYLEPRLIAKQAPNLALAQRARAVCLNRDCLKRTSRNVIRHDVAHFTRSIIGIRYSRIANSECRKGTQKTKRTWSWNIRGGSTFANAGMAFVAIPTAANWPNVGLGVAVSP